MEHGAGVRVGYLPRTRGDKPVACAIIVRDVMTYPAHAGINLWFPSQWSVEDNLPRTRGDKPGAVRTCQRMVEPTPHTRG